MTRDEERTLEERVARLERMVSALAARGDAPPRPAPGQPKDRGGASGAQPPSSPATADDPARTSGTGPARGAAGPSAEQATSFDDAGRAPKAPPAGEHVNWLGRVGVGFVVLAFAFLLKLSFDRGWITPAFRVGSGLATGVGLIGLGVKLEETRRNLALAMLGGGITLLYLAPFAAFRLYGLFPFWLALSVMSTATILSIVIADRQDAEVLSIVGLVGGVMTPFLLEVASGGTNGLAIYVALVLGGAGIAQFVNRWLMLYGVGIAAGTLALTVVATGFAPGVRLAPLAMILTFWVIGVLSPFAQLIRTEADGHATSRAVLYRVGIAWGSLFTLGLVVGLFDLDRSGSGLLVLGLAGGWGLAARATRDAPLPRAIAAELAAVGAILGLVLLSWSSFSLVLTMVVVAGMLMLVGNGGPPTLELIAHAAAALCAGAFLVFSQYTAPEGVLGLREGSLSRVAFLVMIVVTSMWAREATPTYRLTAYVGLMVWLLSELTLRPNGQALVTIAWAVLGTAALLASMRTRQPQLQMVGLATLGVVAGKMLLFDLAQLDALWRVALFLGFGATLVGLGYLLNRVEVRSE